MNIQTALDKRRQTALDTQIRANGVYMTRRQYVESSLASGAQISVREGQRAIVYPDGRYMLESAISKTAIEYAQSLSRPQ